MVRNKVGKILLTESQIQKKVKELGKKISAEYEGKELHIIGVLKGAVLFLTDLIRNITVPQSLDFIGISSYGKATQTSGVVKITKDLDEDIESKNVLIVEDIVDSGLTLEYLINNLRSRKPASLKVCSLLDKRQNRKTKVKIDYVGFVVPNEFLVGYGLDFNQKYRNLPYIFVLKEDSL